MEPIGAEHFATTDPDFTAVIDASGARWSRSALQRLANRTARALLAADLERGDAVAIVAPNCAEYLAITLGALAAGLYVVPVNWHLARGETAYVLENSGAKAVFAHARLGGARLGQLEQDAPRVRVRVTLGEHAPGFQALEDFVAQHSADELGDRALGRVMTYTSATTGRPKGVRLPLEGSARALSKIVAWHRSLGIEIERDNVHLCACTLYHCAPIEGALLALHMGHRVVLLDGWSAESLLRAIEQHAVTTAFMVPAMFVRLLKVPAAVRAQTSTSTLRFVVHGGAPCPVEVKRQMLEWWGPILWEAYGAAEAQGTIASAADWLARPGTVGKPIEGCTVKILDDDGAELPPHSIGLVYLTRHTGDRFAYFRDPVQTRLASRGEYVTAGDLGYLDEDGFLYLCDRQNDVIISSGMNIYPAEIEHVLVQHPDVADCAVVGVPHELFGEVPKATVVAMPNAVPGPHLTAVLLRYLAERLAPMKLPRRIEYVSELPRDPNGKLQRRRLRGPQA
jgi:long-chain acyl-CoA synthetase